jgi:hypothetical protein
MQFCIPYISGMPRAKRDFVNDYNHIVDEQRFIIFTFRRVAEAILAGATPFRIFVMPSPKVHPHPDSKAG